MRFSLLCALGSFWEAACACSRAVTMRVSLCVALLVNACLTAAGWAQQDFGKENTIYLCLQDFGGLILWSCDSSLVSSSVECS